MTASRPTGTADRSTRHTPVYLVPGEDANGSAVHRWARRKLFVQNERFRTLIIDV